MAWVEDFVYPLYLLLIGSGVLGVAVALITHLLEDRRKKREIEVERKRKELEIKVDIASKMAELIGYQIGEAADITLKRKDTLTHAEEDAPSEIPKKSLADANIIRSKLGIYFPETEIAERWDHYYRILASFYMATSGFFLKDAKQHPNFKRHLDAIRDYFSDNKELKWDQLTPDKPYDENLWSSVANMVGYRGDEIIKDLLKLPIKAF